MRDAMKFALLPSLLLGGCSLFASVTVEPPSPKPTPAAPAPTPTGTTVVEVFPTRPKPAAATSHAMMRGPWLATTNDSASIGELELRFFDVGQGDTTLIKCDDGNIILVDVGGSENPSAVAPPKRFNASGDSKTAKADATKRAIEELLGDEKKVHALFLTHPDMDHYNGLGTVLDASISVEHVFHSGKLSEYKTDWLKGRESAVVKGFEGGTPPGVTCGSTKITVFMVRPTTPVAKKDARNTKSLVLALAHGEADFLLTGDATIKTKEDVLAQLGDNAAHELDAEVLKLAHHGADNTLHAKWFDTVRPTIAVVSSLRGHRYGHPRQTLVDAVLPFLAKAKKHAVSFHDGKCEQEKIVEQELVVECSSEHWHDKELEKALYGTGDLGTVTIKTDGKKITTSYDVASDTTSSSKRPTSGERDPCARRCPNLACGTRKTTDRKGDRYWVTCFSFASDAYKKCMAKNVPDRHIWETCTQ